MGRNYLHINRVYYSVHDTQRGRYCPLEVILLRHGLIVKQNPSCQSYIQLYQFITATLKIITLIQIGSSFQNPQFGKASRPLAPFPQYRNAAPMTKYETKAKMTLCTYMCVGVERGDDVLLTLNCYNFQLPAIVITVQHLFVMREKNIA